MHCINHAKREQEKPLLFKQTLLFSYNTCERSSIFTGEISMCSQMVTSEIHTRFVQILIISLDKTQVKFFPNFTSIPFDYHG